MHPIKLFLKRNSRKSIPSNPLAMKLNSAVYTHRTNDNKSGMYYNTSYFLKKNTPHCLNIDLYPPPPPPPDNDRVCDHNALLAFPQEKISHYTTVWTHTMSRAYIDLLQWMLFNILIGNVAWIQCLFGRTCYCEDCAGPNGSQVAFACDLCSKKLLCTILCDKL